jgi:hypothetical protein
MWIKIGKEITKMIKLKELVSESTWKDRKFGDPLPTVMDYIKEAEPGQGGGGHKEGDVWQTDSGWAAWKPGDKSAEYGIKDKGAADKWAKGEEVGYDDGDHDEKEPAGKLGGGDFERDGGEPEDKPFGGDTGADADSGQPIPAKDLANDPSADTGPDSRGTSWSGDYYGAEDSAEWEDQYKEAEEDGDEEELAQIKWFGEKQGWGDNGEMPKGESIHPLKKMFNRIGG